MSLKYCVYRNLITVLIIIWVTVACTPIKPQSDLGEVATLTDLPTQKSVTSTVDQATPTATETQVSTPTQTATETKTPTPTAESLIQGDIFQDPQSKEEFDTVVLAPSPIDDPENFALWQDEYLKQVYEKLKTYTGPTISDEYTGIAYGLGRLMFISSEWPVISSYKFKFQNEELLTKTFVYMDKRNGELVPLSFTYPPEDSFFYTNYETPTDERVLDISFLWGDKMREVLPNDSMDALLPDTLDEFHYNSLIRFIQNTATPEEKEATIKTMFVVTLFNPRP